MLITLVGMPAAGKTTLGKCLAKELRFKFVDLDHEIEQHTGKNIADLFRQEGESRFREIESSVLELCLQYQNTVLATGGGTPCFHNNMEKLVDNSLCIYILSDLHEATERICQEDQTKRPLFAHLSQPEVFERLEDLYEIRYPFYNKAHIRLAKGI